MMWLSKLSSSWCLFATTLLVLPTSLAQTTPENRTVTPTVCFQGFGALNFRFYNFHLYDDFFRNDTEFVLGESGRFEGPIDIEEFVRFVVPTSPFILSSDGANFPHLVAFDNTTCEFLLLTNVYYQMDPNFAIGSYYNVTLMSRFTYDPHEHYLRSLKLHYTSEWLEEWFGTILNSDRSMELICKVLKYRCPTTYEANLEHLGITNLVNDYPDLATNENYTHEMLLDVPADPECLEALDGLPAMTGERHLDGNSRSCRVIQAASAARNPFHCPHLSFVPIEDDEGQIKCQESAEYDPTGHFTPSDYDLFQEFLTNYSSRVNPETGFKVVIPGDIPSDDEEETTTTVEGEGEGEVVEEEGEEVEEEGEGQEVVEQVGEEGEEEPMGDAPPFSGAFTMTCYTKLVVGMVSLLSFFL